MGELAADKLYAYGPLGIGCIALAVAVWVLYRDNRGLGTALVSARESCARERDELHAKHSEQIADLHEAHGAALTRINDEYNSRLNGLLDKSDAERQMVMKIAESISRRRE